MQGRRGKGAGSGPRWCAGQLPPGCKGKAVKRVFLMPQGEKVPSGGTVAVGMEEGGRWCAGQLPPGCKGKAGISFFFPSSLKVDGLCDEQEQLHPSRGPLFCMQANRFQAASARRSRDWEGRVPAESMGVPEGCCVLIGPAVWTALHRPMVVTRPDTSKAD